MLAPLTDASRLEVLPPEVADEADRGHADELVEDDLLVEDVSIDGMCGVY
jgi:mycofactocin precursor